MKSKSPKALIILDGWGIAPDGPGNAISLARKGFWEKVNTLYPHTQLSASGEDVGVVKGEVGNSEVGHLNIGAGRVVYQEHPRINMSISDGSFLQNSALISAAKNTQKNSSSFHIMGLVSRGSVHSSLEHFFALLWFAKTQNLQNVYLHLFLDGRDSPPKSALGLIKDIKSKIEEIGMGEIATICGRYFAMDRDNRWDRSLKCYRALVGDSMIVHRDPIHLISRSYEIGKTDEFIEPAVFDKNCDESRVKNGDSVVFFNFRPDRARQLTHLFVDPENKDDLSRKKISDLVFVTMTQYEKNLPVLVAFPPPQIEKPLAALISEHGLSQLHIGETEKYAHVTYFINGGREDPFPLEDNIHIPSPKVATYDQKPEMSVQEITDFVSSKIDQDLYDVYIVNFANADMVAHTGNITATSRAVEFLDSSLAKITDSILNKNGSILITSDHGNAEVMINPATNEPDTQHNGSNVPLVAISAKYNTIQNLSLQFGTLADVAPTFLGMLDIQVPPEMTGRNLLVE